MKAPDLSRDGILAIPAGPNVCATCVDPVKQLTRRTDSICIDELLRSYFTNNTLPDSLQNDDPDTICATNQGILGLSSTLHFDPVTSENGDALTSGPNDPGLEDLLNNFTNSALIQHTGARGVLLMVLAAISGLLLHM